MNVYEKYMLRTLDLARLGLGKVSPNPMVGCVVVHEGMIIGEGWHQKFGGPHAEVNALNTVNDKGLLTECTVFVNLEPCSHAGKTPPCTDLLIESGIRKVVIGSEDPNPKVAGSGMARLRQHGIEVIEDVLHDQALELNKRFFINQIYNRPYIVLKWAQTTDGFLAREDYTSKWISSQESRKYVHKWRAEEDAILVGRNTIKFDNPKLNVRDWEGRDPVRVVIDPSNSLSDDSNIKDRSANTLIYNYNEESQSANLSYIKIFETENIIKSILSDLINRGIGSIIVEGGAKTLQGFIESGYWDEARVFTSQELFEKGIEAPNIGGVAVSSCMAIGADLLEIYKKD